MEKLYIFSRKVLGFQGISDEMNETVGVFTRKGLQNSNFIPINATWEEIFNDVPAIDDGYNVGVWSEYWFIDGEHLDLTQQDKERIMKSVPEWTKEDEEFLREFFDDQHLMYIADLRIITE